MSTAVLSPGREYGVNTPGIDTGLLVLRLGLATLIVGLHGWARLERAFGYLVFGTAWPFTELVAELGFPAAGAFAVASALSESVGAILVALGWLARLAAAFLAVDMMVALYNEALGGDSIELPALYFVGAVTLVITGPGRYALGALLSGGANTRTTL